MKCKSCLLLLLMAIITLPVKADAPTQNEIELYKLIMAYRAEHGLPAIPMSVSLTAVAQTHARDVFMYYFEIPEGCNLHSWSAHGRWQKCDYYPDHRNAAGMWSKPKELTIYPGYGYEISNAFTPPTSGVCTPEGSLESWKNSPGHNAVIINQDIWTDYHWNAIGIGMYMGSACVWFGQEVDPAGNYDIPLAVAAAIAVSTPQQTVRTLDQTPIQLPTQTPSVRPEPEPVSEPTPEPAYTPEPSRRRTATRTEETETKTRLIDRYFDYSGRHALYILNVGYTYSCANGYHLVNAALCDFRTTIVGFSILNAEIAVSPFTKRFAYKPQVRFYIPATKFLSVVPYGGVEIDMSYVGTYFSEKYQYDFATQFYVNAIGGAALNLSILPNVPLEVKFEYRHPIKCVDSNPPAPKGFYISAQLYFALLYRRK